MIVKQLVEVYRNKVEEAYAHYLSELSVKNPNIEIGGYMIPNSNKFYKGGEDAFYIQSEGYSIGVFDGVGGWAQHGVDAGLYSNRMSQRCKELAESEREPLRILRSGFDFAKEILGSCTAVVVTFDFERDMLKVINVGDSGCFVYRDDELVFKTKVQEHSFNYPYQLGQGETGSDLPEDGDTYSFHMIKGDIFIAATDGYIDNVFDEETIKLLKENKEVSAFELSKTLSEYALKKSMIPNQITPWSTHTRGRSGKPDDITVIVAYYNAHPTAKL